MGNRIEEIEKQLNILLKIVGSEQIRVSDLNQTFVDEIRRLNERLDKLKKE